MKIAIALLIAIVILLGCTSPIVHRQQAQYPQCNVTQKDKSGNIVVLKIECPGREPFEKTYHIE